ALFKHADELVRDEAKRGIKTVVVVGNDKTLRKVLNAVVDLDLALGMIPIGENNSIAKMFGIPHGESACDVIAARNLRRIDVGNLNGRRFIAGVLIPESRVVMKCDGKFTVEPESTGEIEVKNLLSDQLDGAFETEIRSKAGSFLRRNVKQSILRLRKIAIRTAGAVCAIADGEKVESDKFDISIEPAKLSVIIGRDRAFV
ncbi:MAG: hypothetical protein ACD_76C00139G0001, partial [uncultured bacterium]